MGAAALVLAEGFPRQLIALFGAANESAYYTRFAVWFIRGQLCLLPLACVNKGSFIFLQSLGKARQSSVLSIMREIVFGAGLPLLLPMIRGLYALPFFMAVADILTFAAAAAVLLQVCRSLRPPT